MSQPVTTSDRESEAKRNRERMPQTARIVDAFRAVFGEVRVLWAQENGFEVGEKSPDGIPVSNELKRGGHGR